jgi:hypothetical protein
MQLGSLSIRTLWSCLFLMAALGASSAHSAICNASPRLSSSFIEGYYPADWSLANWDTLFENQKRACIDQLIIQYTAQSDPNNMVTYYPAGSSDTNLGFLPGGTSDIIGDSLTRPTSRGMKHRS